MGVPTGDPEGGTGSSESITLADGAAIRSWTVPADVGDPATPVVFLHGGPGLPDYLAPVARLITTATTHRFDQRGTGGSVWSGAHTVARHVADVAELIDHWGHERVVLVGHSYGTDLACHVLLSHPGRVAGMIMLAGPMTEPWREATRAAERARRTPEQQARLDALAELKQRSEAEEREFLTLSWFTDHADRDRAWAWAAADAVTQRPVNLIMNAQLNNDKRAVALEDRLDRLAEWWPAGSTIIGGDGDPRPASALRRFGARMGCSVEILAGAGHSPWRERPDAFRAALDAARQRIG